MKVLISLVCLGVCVGIVLGETCTTNGDCVATQCNTGNTIICQHPAGDGVTQDGGLCTCEDSSTSGECIRAEDCYGSSVNLNCPDAARHCYDSTCICDRFPIGKRVLITA